MRHIGTLSDGALAQRFVDYLLVRGIESRCEEEPEGWALWIFDEDAVQKARDELVQFEQDPEEPRFLEAANNAASLRLDSERRTEEIRKRIITVRERWQKPLSSQIPITLLLAIGCVTSTFASNFGEWGRPATRWMEFSNPKSSGAEALIEFSHESAFARIREGEVWRLVSPIFLHGSGFHLMGNVYWLIVLGGMIEFHRGSLRFLGLVLLFAVFSNICQAAYQGPLFFGMSGVVYGLFGFIWMRSRFVPESGLYISSANVMLMLIWFVVCMSPSAGPVANAAHAGGLASGVLVGYSPRLFRQRR